MNKSTTNVLVILCMIAVTIGITVVMNRAADEPTANVQLFYYNALEDEKRNNGNRTCDTQAIMSVNRALPESQLSLNATLTTLLEGELTPEEKAWGFETDLPLDGVALLLVDIVEGTANIRISPPNALSDDNECGRNILRNQIERTALQFPDVELVVIDGL